MKLLCLPCDALMALAGVEPDGGSAGLTFTCPGCGASVAMLANPGEMQLVKDLGVTVGGHGPPAGRGVRASTSSFPCTWA